MKVWRLLEFFALFVFVPIAYGARFIPLPIVPILLAVCAYAATRLRADPAFDGRTLGRGRATGRDVVRVLCVAVPVTLVLTALVLWLRPGRFLYLPLHRAGLWALIMVLYPLLSVYPQELIYRAFFHHRYRLLVPDERARRWLGALVFGLHHAVFGNLVAVILAFLGGLKFAHTYKRTQSLALAALEHAIYGCALFTIGLGDLFYNGWLHSGVYTWGR